MKKLALVKHSGLFCSCVKARAYPKRGVPKSTNYRSLKEFNRYKHSSLFHITVRDEEKGFMTLRPRVMYEPGCMTNKLLPMFCCWAECLKSKKETFNKVSRMPSSSSTVVERLPHLPKVEG